jgi:hypothetical protein
VNLAVKFIKLNNYIFIKFFVLDHLYLKIKRIRFFLYKGKAAAKKCCKNEVFLCINEYMLYGFVLLVFVLF